MSTESGPGRNDPANLVTVSSTVKHAGGAARATREARQASAEGARIPLLGRGAGGDFAGGGAYLRGIGVI